MIAQQTDLAKKQYVMEKGRKNSQQRKNDPFYHFLFKGKQLKKEGVSLTLNLNESANQTHSDSVIGIFKDWRVLIGKWKTIHISKGKSNGDAFFFTKLDTGQRRQNGS